MPYVSDRTTHSLAKSSVIALFADENFEAENQDFKNVSFKFDSDGQIERGNVYKYANGSALHFAIHLDWTLHDDNA